MDSRTAHNTHLDLHASTHSASSDHGPSISDRVASNGPPGGQQTNRLWGTLAVRSFTPPEADAPFLFPERSEAVEIAISRCHESVCPAGILVASGVISAASGSGPDTSRPTHLQWAASPR